jgi:hypothetical protein
MTTNGTWIFAPAPTFRDIEATATISKVTHGDVTPVITNESETAATPATTGLGSLVPALGRLVRGTRFGAFPGTAVEPGKRPESENPKSETRNPKQIQNPKLQ